MWSVGVILTFFDDLKTIYPLLAFAGNVLYWTQLNSASSSWSYLICCFCFSIIPTYCESTLTYCKGGAMAQSADTADANADEDVDNVLESLCFSWPPPIVDEQCKVNVIVGVLIWKNEELCSLFLVDIAISDQCAHGLTQFKMKTCHFSSSDFWNTEDFNVHISWVILNQDNCLHYCNFSRVKYFWMSENLILPPLLFSIDFTRYIGLQYVHNFLVF